MNNAETTAAAAAEENTQVTPKKPAARKKAASNAQQTALVAPQGANVAPEKAATKKGASQKKAAPKGRKTAKRAKAAEKTGRTREPKTPREVTAKSNVIRMLHAKAGATLDAIMKTTGWQAHTTRGFISLLKSKAGLNVESTRREDGKRVYSIAR